MKITLTELQSYIRKETKKYLTEFFDKEDDNDYGRTNIPAAYDVDQRMELEMEIRKLKREISRIENDILSNPHLKIKQDNLKNKLAHKEELLSLY